MTNRNFDEWLSKFRPSISSYDYYIDFEKVVRNVDEIKVELNILNSLIGSKNIEEDFEKIVTDISPETGLKVSEIDTLGERHRNSTPILIAEDSPLLEKLIMDSLKKAGYTNVIATTNGQEAWDKLTKFKEAGVVYEKVKCIITDIEMPIMDGHRLTRLVKGDDTLKSIPVVIFSSLVNEEMRKKGENLGSDAQLSKPEIGNLVRIIDGLLGNE